MGFVIDSTKMTVSLIEEKEEHIIMKIKKFLKKNITKLKKTYFNNRFFHFNFSCSLHRKSAQQSLERKKMLPEKDTRRF